VRHLDRALCHGVAVPPPRRTRVSMPKSSAGPP
jgi:hypothetical protein